VTESNDDAILCHVIDEGSGVQLDLRDHLFEVRASTKGSGRGQGLYATRHLLQENGAQIALTRSDEMGSIFTICFPKPMQEDA
jgi:sensor histidine kinase regulating citrate/malate metabolism